MVAAQRRAYGLGRERAEAGDAERPGAYPVVAELVERVLDRAEDRAERDDDQLGVLGTVRPHEPAAWPAELALEGGGDVRDQLKGLPHPLGRQVPHLGECLGADHGADRHRVLWVEYLARLVQWEEGVDFLLARDVHGLRPGP